MIKVCEISKSFHSGRGDMRALRAVSFTLPAHQTMVIAGKSGSGKSTLLNCIGGLEHPDEGSVWCHGQNLARLSRRDLSRFQRTHMGFVFQFSNLLSYLTVEQNIAFPLFLNQSSRQERSHRVAELLESVGLPDAGKALPTELSGGEVQRVAFARAIAHYPGILLADEPTASLDSVSGISLVQMMIDLCRVQKSTLIVATHDEDIIRLAHHTLRLRDGLVIG